MLKPPHFRKKNAQETPEEGSVWLNPYFAGIVVGGIVLIGVLVYHFFFSGPIVGDKISARDSSANGGDSKTAFSFLGRSFFSKKPPLDLSSEDLEAMGIPEETKLTFKGVVPENFREKKRLVAIQKVEAARKAGNERTKIISELVNQRNSGVNLDLREAVETIQDADNLALMKLESFVERQKAARGASSAPATKGENESLLFAYQCLTDIYLKKRMKEKAVDAYLNYLKIMKEKAPEGQGQLYDQAISEFERARVTSAGN